MGALMFLICPLFGSSRIGGSFYENVFILIEPILSMRCPHCGKEIPDDYGEDDEEEKLDHVHVPGIVCYKCHPSAGLIAL